MKTVNLQGRVDTSKTRWAQLSRGLWTLALLLFLPAAILANIDSGARFSSISREVEVFPESTPDQRSFATGKTVLNVDDHVTTGEDSNAVICFADLSTLMVKAESEVVIAAPPEQPGRVDLVKGRLWLNVKKVIAGEEIEVKSNLATTGIKGTIVTCLSRPDKSEDVIQVLRGSAEVTVDETREKTILEEGQELRIKAGGASEKRSIDIEQETADWQGELSTLGSAVDLQDIPNAVGQTIERQSRSFKQLKDAAAGLSGPGDAKTPEFLKEASRFQSALFEDGIILDNFEVKVDRALADPGLTQERSRLASTKKSIADGRARTRTHLGETASMVKRFAGAGILDPVEMSRQQMASIWSEIDTYRQELEAAGRSMSQAWFEETRQQTSIRYAQHQVILRNLQTLREQKPQEEAVAAAVKLALKYDAAIQLFLRELNVPIIDAELVLRMQERADLLEFEVGNLQSEVAAYPTITANAQMEDRIRGSMSLVKRFTAVRRVYVEAQRLYKSIQRSASGSRYRTTEMEEMATLFQRVDDRYQEIQLAYDDIRASSEFIENQLTPLLK